MSQIIPLFKRVAQTVPEQAGVGRVEKFFVFHLDGKNFAIPAVDVTEVAVYSSIIDVPSSSKIVSGVVNVRGTVIPIVNIRSRLGMQSIFTADDKTKIVYFTVKQGFLIGMIVDDIEYRLRDGIIEPDKFAVVEGSSKKLKEVVIEEKEIRLNLPVFFIDDWIEKDEFCDIEKLLKTF